jgi:hypothetical protein
VECRAVDPDPDSMTLWIRIQGIKNKKMKNNVTFVLVFVFHSHNWRVRNSTTNNVVLNTVVTFNLKNIFFKSAGFA